MDLDGRRLWQVGAGNTDRNYGALCILHDVMLVGPGNPGPYDPPAYARLGDIGKSIRRFYLEAQRSDPVLLRIGTAEVLALGEIMDHNPGYSAAFGDIDGWDLQHHRRVRWFGKSAKTFPSTTLGGQVRTFAQVRVPSVVDWVRSFEPTRLELQRELAPLPEPGRVLEDQEFASLLFTEGLSSEAVDRLMQRLASLRRVAAWYSNPRKRPTGRPSERETVAYLVLPLMFALGWSEQTAAVEWNRLDVALFERMPSNDDTLTCVVEAKTLERSVFSPVGQAVRYATEEGRGSCKRLIITDGIRYAFHRRSTSSGDFELVAYLNLLRLCDSYPALGCGGAVEAIIGMSREHA